MKKKRMVAAKLEARQRKDAREERDLLPEGLPGEAEALDVEGLDRDGLALVRALEDCGGQPKSYRYQRKALFNRGKSSE